MNRRHNPRFKCTACRRWCIRRGTDNTRRIAYHPQLCRLCIECAEVGLQRDHAQELRQLGYLDADVGQAGVSGI